MGRNDLCPCGSGKKYKKCCMSKDIADTQSDESVIIQSEPKRQKNPRLDEIENNINRATNLMEEGKYEQSARAFRSVILMDKDNYKAITGLGKCLAEIGMVEEACKCFERALEINPNYSQAKLNLAFYSKK
ncbi:MAG: tetratricopeptide repeat protein [Candidatus Poribacteria bacterium]